MTQAAPAAACAAGLQIHTHGAWEDVPSVPGTFIINLGGCLLHVRSKHGRQGACAVVKSTSQHACDYP
jgi:isopenicillin N synthase-like dioxygenase